MSTPEEFFAELLRSEPSRPFVTYYDEASGERSELSAKSLANWVAKTHHLLGDELGLGAGDVAFLALPAHWISVPIVLGCLTAGLCVTAEAAGADDAAVAFVTPQTLAQAAGVPDLYAIAPAAAAVGLAGEAPSGATDYVSAVRPHEDKWPSVRFGAGPQDVCLPGMTRADVAEESRRRAASLGMTAGMRVLSTRDWLVSADWIDTLLAPLSVGGSLVYLRGTSDPAVITRRAEQERATLTLTG